MATPKSTSVAVIYPGHEVAVTGSSGDWHHITDETTGLQGWMPILSAHGTPPTCLG